MNLYLISQNENIGYDTHDSAVVCASDEQAARQINPGYGDWGKGSTWCSSPEHVTVRYLGPTAGEPEQGVILASFNAFIW